MTAVTTGALSKSPLDVQRSLVEARQDLDRTALSSELPEQQRIAQPQAQPQPAGPLVHYVDTRMGPSRQASDGRNISPALPSKSSSRLARAQLIRVNGRRKK
jgi:hypothetical protein